MTSSRWKACKIVNHQLSSLYWTMTYGWSRCFYIAVSSSEGWNTFWLPLVVHKVGYTQHLHNTSNDNIRVTSVRGPSSILVKDLTVEENPMAHFDILVWLGQVKNCVSPCKHLPSKVAENPGRFVSFDNTFGGDIKSTAPRFNLGVFLILCHLQKLSFQPKNG